MRHPHPHPWFSASPRRWRTAALTACLAAIGCGPANGRLEVSGRVTLDGAPLDQGSITFADPTGKLPTAGALIQGGAYRIPDGKGLRPGDYLVAVDSADADGPKASVGPGGMAIPVSRIPPRYNAATTLEATVTAGGSNEFDFDLETDQ